MKLKTFNYPTVRRYDLECICYRISSFFEVFSSKNLNQNRIAVPHRWECNSDRAINGLSDAPMRLHLPLV